MQRPKRLTHSEFKKIYSKVPRAVVEAIIKSQEGILLAKRKVYPFEGYWHIPGGTIFLGETIQSATKRIAFDETGLKVKIQKIVGVVEYDVYKNYGQPIGIATLSTPQSGRLKADFQSDELRYFKKVPPKTIPQQARFIKSHNLV